MLTIVLVAAQALACPGNPNCSDSHCTMPATQTAAATAPADGAKATLDVSGMTCGSCASKVQTALLGIEGVKAATVDVTTGKAEVTYDAAKTSPDKLAAAITAGGHYTAKVHPNS